MNQVQFSVAAHAAWAPNLVTQQEWLNWANCPVGIQGNNEPGVLAMSSLLRRRAGFLGKMALEVAYACLSDREMNEMSRRLFFVRGMAMWRDNIGFVV